MNIGERIASLSEDEAKFALVNFVHYTGAMAECSRCIFARYCEKNIGALGCKKKFLDWSLGGVENGEK